MPTAEAGGSAYDGTFNAEVDDLVQELAALGYWQNRTSYLWLEGRKAEIAP